MPSHNDRRARQGVWSHWVPLIFTVTVATAGLAAWAWSQRKDEHEGAAGDDQYHEPDLDYDNADYGDNPPYGAANRDIGRQHPQQPPSHGQTDESFGVSTAVGDPNAANWGARMSGALRRTPSPQQFFDSTGRTITAGVAAAGAVMGKALASIREDDKYPADNNPWSEEADAKKDRVGGPSSSGGKRRTVVIVVSADAQLDDMDEDPAHEHASILSHIPKHIDYSKVKLLVLVYAPSMKEAGADATSSNLPPASLSSSFSNIGHDQAQTPGEETKSPVLGATSSVYNAVYSQALGLVEKETMILPFTTPNGHVHILRHLQPDVIYLQESLSGDNGSIITNMQTWLRHDVILVVGAEQGSGGLADSESEAERTSKVQQWWQKPERVGRGRGIVVVDGMRVHDDWVRRVQGHE